MMRQFQIILLALLAVLSGCGEVTVFGHVVREGHPKDAVKADSSSSASSATASASSSSQDATPVAPVAPVIPPVAATPSSSPSAPEKVTAVATEPIKALRQIKTVTLSIAPEMMDKMAKDSRFNKKALIDAIQSELQSRKLLDTSDSQTGTTLSIYIDNYDLHATTNFVIFGVRPHTGTLAGNLALRDEQGEATPVSHVEAYSRISVPESGEDQKLLQPLYHEFAVTVANSLGGTHVPTSIERDQPPR